MIRTVKYLFAIALGRENPRSVQMPLLSIVLLTSTTATVRNPCHSFGTPANSSHQTLGWVGPRVVAYLWRMRFTALISSDARAGHNRSKAYKGLAGTAFSCHPFFSQQGFIRDASSPQKWSHFHSLLHPIHPLAAWQTSEQSQKSAPSQPTVMKNFHGFLWSHMTLETRTPKSYKMQQVCMPLGNLSMSVNSCGQWGVCRFIAGFIKENQLLYLKSWRPMKFKSEAKAEIT